MDAEGEGALQRWSRRKAAARAGAPAPSEEGAVPVVSAPVEELPAPPAAAGVPPAPPPPPPLTDADMPPLSTLGEQSDFSGFFSPGVSAGLRKAALRQLFALPRHGRRDGLDDYDEDFTAFEPLGDTPTNDPFSRRQRRLEAEAAEREAAEREAAADGAGEEGASDDEASDGVGATPGERADEAVAEAAGSAPDEAPATGGPGGPRRG